MQTEIRDLQVLDKPKLLDESLVAKCRDGKDAIILCIQARTVRYPMHSIAEHLGIDKGHFSRIMSGQAHFPDEARPELMTLCGNFAPLQYEAMVMGFTLAKEDKKKKAIQELENKLKELKAS